LRCLVTGGLGFIGSHLVKRLFELRHDVMTLDDSSNAAFRPIKRVPNEDYAGDLTDLLRWPRDIQYDWVFHLAAISRTPQAVAHPFRCHQVNATGSLIVLEWVRDVCPKARVVLASSNIVYGSPNPYRASKLAMEEYMSAYNELYGLDCIALRYSNVYGPGMRWDDLICLASMRRSMVERGYIELTGDGTQSRDFTHVSDIVDGTIVAAESSQSLLHQRIPSGAAASRGYGQPFSLSERGVVDVSSGHHRTMGEIAVQLFTGSRFNENGCDIRFVEARAGDTKRIRQSNEWLSDALGRPTITPEEGIRDVLAEVPQGVRA